LTDNVTFIGLKFSKRLWENCSFTNRPVEAA